MGKSNWGKMAYGVFLLFLTTAIALPAQTFTTLHSFDGSDGADPYAGLVQATDGNLYGLTYNFGAYSGGTVFKITPSGMLTTLYSFCSRSGCADGEFPIATLVQAADGNFYGTTEEGGTSTYFGTVFKITPSGTLTTLHSFCSQSDCADGGQPFAALAQGANGELYGTTSGFGVHDAGTVFKITPSGMLTTLYSFCSQSGCTDGSQPFATLVQDTDGNFYGTTSSGGAHGYGTIFKVTPSGTLTTLYSFCVQANCTDGETPYAGLVHATNGNFYGTTLYGGAHSAGTVFKITPSGMLTTLYSFCSQSGCADGETPYAGLVQATDANLYGLTHSGGAHSAGTIFKINPSGKLTMLYAFCAQAGCADSAQPWAALVQDTNGKFYGTANGGSYDDGAVFRLSVGLGPFVETQPASGKVGAPVTILGTHLTGATSVTFNGTAATFTVVSSSEIKTRVPAGATTGKVKVKTPGGTLTSNVNFRVRVQALPANEPGGGGTW